MYIWYNLCVCTLLFHQEKSSSKVLAKYRSVFHLKRKISVFESESVYFTYIRCLYGFKIFRIYQQEDHIISNLKCMFDKSHFPSCCVKPISKSISITLIMCGKANRFSLIMVMGIHTGHRQSIVRALI